MNISTALSYRFGKQQAQMRLSSGRTEENYENPMPTTHTVM
jgi:hypothetical protein